MPPCVRPGTARDAAAIAAIYNEGIEERLATFETEPRSKTAPLTWIADDLPLVVVCPDEAAQPVAWAVSHPYRSRRVYDALGAMGERRSRG